MQQTSRKNGNALKDDDGDERHGNNGNNGKPIKSWREREGESGRE